jgi:hypothetical protein
MIKTIHGENYKLLNEEFKTVDHIRFNHLNIIPELNYFERVVSLLRELSKVLKVDCFVHMSPTHGGYIPIEMSSYIENIYMYIVDTNQIENIMNNLTDRKLTNVHIGLPQFPSTSSIIFLGNVLYAVIPKI